MATHYQNLGGHHGFNWQSLETLLQFCPQDKNFENLSLHDPCPNMYKVSGKYRQKRPKPQLVWGALSATEIELHIARQ